MQPMRDTIKFRVLIIFTSVLAAAGLAYNILQEYWLPDIQGYLQRRIYYEKVISPKGLELHKGMHWKETE